MGALLSHRCPSCGESHQFFLPGPGVMFCTPGIYRYTCPKTGKSADLVNPEPFAKLDARMPAGAVIVQSAR